MRSLLLVLLLLATSACGFGSVVTIKTATLPNGQVGIAYSATIIASGGNTPYTWSVTALPAGIASKPSSDTRSLYLSGSPTTAGSYRFSVTAQGQWKHKSTVTYAITIASGVPHTVTLSCTPSISNGVTEYRFYRSGISGGYYALLGSSPTCSYVDSNVIAGTVYYYVATAWDGTIESAWSSQAVATL